MSRFFLVALSISLVALPARAQSALDLVPQEAAVALAIRDLDDLMKKGDKFLVDADIRQQLRPSDVFNIGAGFLGVNKGLDRKRPAALVLVAPEDGIDFKDFRWIEDGLVPILPFTDADAMAANFGIAKGKFLPKTIHRTNRQDAFISRYAGRQQDHIYLCGSEKTLQRLQKSKSVAGNYAAAQRKLLDESDILLHFGRQLLKNKEFNLSDAVRANLNPGNDPQEKLFAALIAECVAEIQSIGTGVRLVDGLEGHLFIVVPKAGKANTLLSLLRDVPRPSGLNGLPDGNVLFAQASAGKSGHQKLLAKALFRFLLDELLLQYKLVEHVDRLQYLGIFNEVWSQLDGNRLAVYQNVDEGKIGLFSAVAILDVDNPPEFLRDMKTLAKMATADGLDFSKNDVKEEIDIAKLVKDLGSMAFKVRNSADIKLVLIGETALPYLQKAIDSKELDLETLRRCENLRQQISDVAANRRKELLRESTVPLFLRPKLTFITNAEKRGGQSIDAIQIKLSGYEKAVAQQSAEYKQLLGPDWDKVRVAIVGKQIVAMLGSNVELFDTAVRNVQKNEPGLAASKQLANFTQRSAKERLFELHVSVEGILRLTTPMAPVGTKLQLTSLGLALGDGTVQLDAQLPTSEIRAITRKVEPMVP